MATSREIAILVEDYQNAKKARQEYRELNSGCKTTVLDKHLANTALGLADAISEYIDQLNGILPDAD